MNDEIRQYALTEMVHRLMTRLFELSEQLPGTYVILDPHGHDVAHVTLTDAAGITFVDPSHESEDRAGFWAAYGCTCQQCGMQFTEFRQIRDEADQRWVCPACGERAATWQKIGWVYD